MFDNFISKIKETMSPTKVSLQIQKKIDDDQTIILGAEMNLDPEQSIAEGHNILFSSIIQSMEQFL